MKKRYSGGSGVGFGDDTPFNSSLAYLERLERRWEDADDAKIEGNMIMYFRTLHTLFMNTHPFFSDEENDECKNLIIECEASIEEVKGKMSPSDAQMFISEIEKSLDSLRMKLVTLLFKYKITYFQRNATKWQDQVEDDYT